MWVYICPIWLDLCLDICYMFCPIWLDTFFFMYMLIMYGWSYWYVFCPRWLDNYVAVL